MINNTGVIFTIFKNLSVYVFGNIYLTFIFLNIALTGFAMLIQIPLPYAIALNIPFAIIMAAYGLIPIYIAILLVVVYLVLAVFSMLAQFN